MSVTPLHRSKSPTSWRWRGVCYAPFGVYGKTRERERGTGTVLLTDTFDGLIPILLQILGSPSRTETDRGLVASVRLVGRMVWESGPLVCVGSAATRPEIVDQSGELRHGFLSISKIFHLAHVRPYAAVIRGFVWWGSTQWLIKSERVLP